MSYFSGQGKLFIASRDANGKAMAFRQVGNVPSLKISLATDVAEHQDSQSGKRIMDARIIKTEKCEVAFALEEFNADNLAVALYGQKATVAGASVVGEVLPDDLAVDDYVRLKYPKVSEVVVHDSSVGPASLVEGTDYEVESADHGTLKILDLAAYTQPFKVDYTYADHTNLPMFNQTPPERWLRFEGLNTADTSKPVLIEIYRALLNPLKDFDLISDDFAKFELDGSALYDGLNAADAQLGGFGRVAFL